MCQERWHWGILFPGMKVLQLPRPADEAFNLQEPRPILTEPPSTQRLAALPPNCSCQLWVVNPARGGQKELSGGAAERTWADAAAALAADAAAEGSGSQVETPPPPRFEVAYVKSGEAALKQIQRELSRIKWVKGNGLG